MSEDKSTLAASGAAGCGPAVRFGRYEFVARLGHGGMAQVYLARHRGPMGFEKLVVIKVIHPHLATQQQFIDMFLDEARIAARISNHRVVQIYELGEERGRYFIAMEYLAGESLSALIRAGSEQGRPLDPRQAARIIAGAAEGLHAAHELKSFTGESLEVVHRDVSPGNVVVLYDGGVKVVDFGVAKAKGKVGQTTGGELKGKFAYMTPEQLEDGRVDRRSDVFSLGIVLWEALALTRLFRASTDAATVRAILAGKVAPPSRFRAGIPLELESIALKALAPAQSNRYQTAQEMCDALEDSLHGGGGRVTSRDLSDEMHKLFPERIRARERVLERLAHGGPEVEVSSEALVDNLEQSDSSSLSLPWSTQEFEIADEETLLLAEVEAARAEGELAGQKTLLTPQSDAGGAQGDIASERTLLTAQHEAASGLEAATTVEYDPARPFAPAAYVDPAPRRSPFLMLAGVLGAAALLGAIGAVAWSALSTPEVERSTSTATEDDEDAERADAPRDETGNDTDGIDGVLDRAEEAIRKRHFTYPPGKNALELILHAEEVREDDPRAAELERRAAAEAIRVADRLWKAGQEDAARYYYHDALWFEPGHALATRRAAGGRSEILAAAATSLGKEERTRLRWLASQLELAILERRITEPPEHNARAYLTELKVLDRKNGHIRSLEEHFVAAAGTGAPGDDVATTSTPAPAEAAATSPATSGAGAMPPAKPAVAKAAAKGLVEAGHAHLKAWRYDAAGKAFKEALAANPRSHAALAGLAEVAFQQGDAKGAISYGKRAVKLAPRVAPHHMSLGKAYFDSGEYEMAVEHWKTVLKIKPGNAAALKNLERARAKL